MKFLVTGAAGLVGTNVVNDLVNQNHEVYSAFHDTKPQYGIPLFLDLKNFAEIRTTINKIKPEKIIHLGALTNVDLCETEKESAYMINTKSTGTLAKEAAKINAFFLFVSTDYVFDGIEGLKKEDELPNPLGYYGKTKLEGELSLNNFPSNWAITRTSTPFGLHPQKKTFPIWVKENLEKKISINVLTDQYTSPTYVPNLSKMLIEVAIREFNGTLHLAGATRISRYDFAEKIAEKLELDKKFLKRATTKDMNWKAKRPLDSSLDVTKALELLHEKPQTIEQSLSLFIDELINL
jgi:dTDP-4-dehydrorhamnose reductase